MTGCDVCEAMVCQSGHGRASRGWSILRPVLTAFSVFYYSHTLSFGNVVQNMTLFSFVQETASTEVCTNLLDACGGLNRVDHVVALRTRLLSFFFFNQSAVE